MYIVHHPGPHRLTIADGRNVSTGRVSEVYRFGKDYEASHITFPGCSCLLALNTLLE